MIDPDTQIHTYGYRITTTKVVEREFDFAAVAFFNNDPVGQLVKARLAKIREKGSLSSLHYRIKPLGWMLFDGNPRDFLGCYSDNERDTYNNLGNLFTKQNINVIANLFFLKAENFIQLAKNCFADERYEAALAYAQTALRKDNSNVLLHQISAKIYQLGSDFLKPNPFKALKHHEQVLSMKPSHIDTLVDAAELICYYKLDDRIEEAHNNCILAEQIEPDSKHSKCIDFLLAYIYTIPNDSIEQQADHAFARLLSCLEILDTYRMSIAPFNRIADVVLRGGISGFAEDKLLNLVISIILHQNKKTAEPDWHEIIRKKCREKPRSLIFKLVKKHQANSKTFAPRLNPVSSKALLYSIIDCELQNLSDEDFIQAVSPENSDLLYFLEQVLKKFMIVEPERGVKICKELQSKGNNLLNSNHFLGDPSLSIGKATTEDQAYMEDLIEKGNIVNLTNNFKKYETFENQYFLYLFKKRHPEVDLSRYAIPNFDDPTTLFEITRGSIFDIVKKYPNNVNILHSYAKHLMEKDFYYSAKDVCEKAMEVCPSSHKVRKLLEKIEANIATQRKEENES